MASHKVRTSNAEITAAVRKAGRLQEPLAIWVESRESADGEVLTVRFDDGTSISFRCAEIEGLQGASISDSRNVEIIGNGTGLHWPLLDLDLYLPALRQRILGTKAWMRQIGRKGGTVKSDVKCRSSQSNGRKGGRPSKVKVIVSKKIQAFASESLSVSQRRCPYRFELSVFAFACNLAADAPVRPLPRLT